MDDCKHEHKELRHRIGNNSFTMQCMECGRTFGSIKHSKLTPLQMEVAPVVDESIQDRWWKAKREAAEIKRTENSQSWFRQHSEYLMSPEWKGRRMAVLRRDGYMCQACLQNQAAQVHHLTYDHWGNEPLFDLISVCIPCHERITKMDRSRRGTVVSELTI